MDWYASAHVFPSAFKGCFVRGGAYLRELSSGGSGSCRERGTYGRGTASSDTCSASTPDVCSPYPVRDYMKVMLRVVRNVRGARPLVGCGYARCGRVGSNP